MLEFNATFLVAMFSFVVFIFIMNAIFYEPVLSVMKKRRDYIASNYDEANEIEQKSKEIDNNISAQILSAQNSAREELNSAVFEARKESDKNTSEIIENLKQQFQTQKDDLYRQKTDIETDLGSEITDELADDISSKLLGGVK